MVLNLCNAFSDLLTSDVSTKTTLKKTSKQASPDAADLDREQQAALELLHSKRAEWASLSYSDKAALLSGMIARVERIDFKEFGVTASLEQGYQPGPGAGDAVASVEQLVNVMAITDRLRMMLRTYKSLAATGAPPPPASTITTSDGRAKSLVFPLDDAEKADRTAQSGVTIEVHSMPGEAGLQQKPLETPGLCLVLGAGNQSFLSFGDVLHQMFVEGKVCVLKHHPLR